MKNSSILSMALGKLNLKLQTAYFPQDWKLRIFDGLLQEVYFNFPASPVEFCIHTRPVEQTSQKQSSTKTPIIHKNEQSPPPLLLHHGKRDALQTHLNEKPAKQKTL